MRAILSVRWRTRGLDTRTQFLMETSGAEVRLARLRGSQGQTRRELSAVIQG